MTDKKKQKINEYSFHGMSVNNNAFKLNKTQHNNNVRNIRITKKMFGRIRKIRRS